MFCESAVFIRFVRGQWLLGLRKSSGKVDGVSAVVI
jgi:hypothetical protein